MKNFKEEIKRSYVILGNDGEAENIKHINYWYDTGKITASQKDHLLKFNSMLAR